MKSPVIWVPYENYMWQIFLNFWGVGWGDVASGQYCRQGIIFNFLFFFWLGGSLRRGGNATVASGQYCGQGIMCNYLFFFWLGVGWGDVASGQYCGQGWNSSVSPTQYMRGSEEFCDIQKNIENLKMGLLFVLYSLYIMSIHFFFKNKFVECVKMGFS